MLHRIPFLRLFLFFTAGIVIRWYWTVPIFILSILLFVSVGCFILSFVPKLNRQYRFRFLFGIGLACLLFATAVFITQNSIKKTEWNISKQNYLYQAIITDEPANKPKTRMCKIRITKAEEIIHPAVAGKKAIIYIPVDSLSHTLVAGDCLIFYGQLEPPVLPYLKKQSVAATGFIRKNQWTKLSDSHSAFSVRLKALSVRRPLLHRLQQIIPDPSSYAIAAALMFGYRSEMDADLMQAFRNIGAAHILAISGTHFAILFGACYFLLSKAVGNSRKGRRLQQEILLPIAWGFAFLTGFSPSVVRAVVMLTIWGVGDMFGRRAFTLNTVAVAAFFMLLLNPFYLFDIGFQLSFSAVVFIIVLNPYLMKLYESRNPALRYLWNLTCVSISAQTGVLPLSVYYFHQFPIIFLLANLCLLPLVSVVLYLIPVSMLLHSLVSGATWLVYPLNQVLGFFISITQTLDQFSYSSINNLYIGDLDLITLSVAVVLTCFLFIKKRAVYLYLLIITVVVLLL